VESEWLQCVEDRPDLLVCVTATDRTDADSLFGLQRHACRLVLVDVS
jgi:hypothetical protein